MTFTANLYATGKFGHVLTALFLLAVCSLFYLREYLALLIFVCVVIVAVARLYNRKISFDGHVFRYDGWIRSIEVPYSQIVKVDNAESLGYPVDRLHGPHEYRITTKHQKVWVSLLWFHGEAACKFREKISKPRKPKHG
jgi:hypothetical protein